MPSDSVPDAALRAPGKPISSSAIWLGSRGPSSMEEVDADSLSSVMTACGVKPSVKILYIADYVEPKQRIMKNSGAVPDGQQGVACLGSRTGFVGRTV